MKNFPLYFGKTFPKHQTNKRTNTKHTETKQRKRKRENQTNKEWDSSKQSRTS